MTIETYTTYGKIAFGTPEKREAAIKELTNKELRFLFDNTRGGTNLHLEIKKEMHKRSKGPFSLA